METKKIIIGEQSKITWLMDAVEDHIRKNPMIDDIEIHNHLKIRLDIIANALTTLRITNRIERIFLSGKTCFRILEITEEEIRAVSMPMPFGTFN